LFLKPVQCNCFIYFGVIVSEGEIKSAMKRLKHKSDDIYGFVFSKGLQFQRIGNSKKSARFVIGKEIFDWYAFTQMELSFDNDNINLLNRSGNPINVRLSQKEQHDITMKISALGFYNLTNYYMIHNYEINNV